MCSAVFIVTIRCALTVMKIYANKKKYPFNGRKGVMLIGTIWWLGFLPRISNLSALFKLFMLKVDSLVYPIMLIWELLFVSFATKRVVKPYLCAIWHFLASAQCWLGRLASYSWLAIWSSTHFHKHVTNLEQNCPMRRHSIWSSPKSPRDDLE